MKKKIWLKNRRLELISRCNTWMSGLCPEFVYYTSWGLIMSRIQHKLMWNVSSVHLTKLVKSSCFIRSSRFQQITSGMKRLFVLGNMGCIIVSQSVVVKNFDIAKYQHSKVLSFAVVTCGSLPLCLSIIIRKHPAILFKSS